MASFVKALLGILIFTTPLLAGPAARPTAARSAVPPDLDAVVARTMREFEVPGLALAIVKDGAPVLNADAYVTFALDHDGNIEQMTMAPVSPLTDFSFDFKDLLFTPVRGGAAESR